MCVGNQKVTALYKRKRKNTPGNWEKEEICKEPLFCRSIKWRTCNGNTKSKSYDLWDQKKMLKVDYGWHTTGGSGLCSSSLRRLLVLLPCDWHALRTAKPRPNRGFPIFFSRSNSVNTTVSPILQYCWKLINFGQWHVLSLWEINPSRCRARLLKTSAW